MEVGIGIVFVLIWLVFLVVMVTGVVLWVIDLVEVITLPEWQYKRADSDKTMWVIVFLLLGVIAMLIWRIGFRQKVRAQAGNGPPPGYNPYGYPNYPAQGYNQQPPMPQSYQPPPPQGPVGPPAGGQNYPPPGDNQPPPPQSNHLPPGPHD